MLVGPVRLELTTKGLCLPPRLSSPLSGLWSGLYLPITGWPSSLYTFNDTCASKLGSVLADSDIEWKLSPTLTSSTCHQSKLGNRQPSRNSPCTDALVFRLVSLSPLL